MRFAARMSQGTEISQFMPDPGRDLLSEICIQISDTGLIRTSSGWRQLIQRQMVERSAVHAAWISQLRIPSLTPSQLILKALRTAPRIGATATWPNLPMAPVHRTGHIGT